MTVDRTPPIIVSEADNPEAALAAFIGQELEQWGFEIMDFTVNDKRIWVDAGGTHMAVTVSHGHKGIA